jgi:uncharacterized membrane protein YtjA (UPF0391 family)
MHSFVDKAGNYPMANRTLQSGKYFMISRALISLVLASVSALFGFTGILQTAAPLAQTACFGFAGFSLLSLLFALFEEEPIVSKPNFADEQLATSLVETELPLDAQFARVGL